ncbi:hypothetical protein OH77DRAFT_1424455 [Trametes cingulata]|nr:hypothetical protein OH77DRAFT_1431799 [Trametes cingulata]KAI0356116.1 hypothetical protein OH77DRAFT_1424455 [Trametes cingulata]
MPLASALRLGPIQDGICDSLTPLELIRLGKTCRSLQGLVNDYIRSAFHPHRLLSTFFRDVPAFRSIQAQTASLISGPAALNFFDRNDSHADWPLDIIVYFHHRTLVAHWLIACGYTFVASMAQSPDLDFTITEGALARKEVSYEEMAVCDVLLFHKACANKSLVINLVITTRSPAEVILHAHSTCLLNIISYERAYCMYPRATLHDRRSLLVRASGKEWRGRADELEEMIDRGYDVVDTLFHEDFNLPDEHRCFTLGWRWIDDPFAWVIDFEVGLDIALPPPANSLSSARTHDPVAICGFALRCGPDEEPYMEFVVIKGPAVEYSYVLGDQDSADRLITELYFKSPVWDGRYWDEESREICKKLISDCSAQRALRALEGLRRRCVVGP